jgi:hypothetical protein
MINEVEYGDWSGKRLVALARKKEWKTVQESPSRMYFPGGEGNSGNAGTSHGSSSSSSFPG